MTREEVMREVRRLELTTRQLVRDLVAGEYASAFRGRGVEFSEVREYQPGDDVRTIDWNVTARLGSAHIKRYQEERELSIMLAVDFSASGLFGTRRRTKRELAIELAAILGMAGARSNDRVGACFFTDRIERFTPPAKGRRQALRLISDLLEFSPTGRATDLPAVAGQLAPLLPRRSILFIISDLAVEGDQLSRALALLAPRHEVIALRLADPLERELPSVGLITLADPETGAWRVVDSSSPAVRGYLEARAREFDTEVDERCRHHGVDLLRLETGTPYGESLVRFFERRRHQKAS